MRRKRYNVLDGALKYLRTNDNDANPVAPTGTALRRYQQVKSGEVNVSYNRDENSNPEELLKVAVVPFGLPNVDASRTIVPISKRTLDATTISALRTAGNIITDTNGISLTLEGFEPAKCFVRIPDSSKDNPNAESQITGLRYNKKGSRSYTFPYGAKTGEDKEIEVRTSIVAAIPNDSNYSVSFNSENL